MVGTYLELPSAKHKAQYQAFIAELGDEERYPFVLDWPANDFTVWLNQVDDYRQGRNIPVERVPSTTYFLMLDQQLVGVANLRHTLNDAIRECGGHVGLSIRPSQRGNGFSCVLLRAVMQQALGMGLTELEIHCHQSNSASAAMIEACGGVLHSTITVTGEPHPIARYRCPL